VDQHGPRFRRIAAARNYGKDSSPRGHHRYIMLQLRHLFLSGGSLRKGPGQHELGFEDRIAASIRPSERCHHPAEGWMVNAFLPTMPTVSRPLTSGRRRKACPSC
jgi:hypothetical protein